MLLALRSAGRAVKNHLSRYEPIAVLTVGIATLGAFLFIRLTSEMLEGETRAFDESVLKSLRQAGDPAIPIGPKWLTYAFTDITALGGTTVLTLVTTLVVIYLLLARQRLTALFVLLAVLGGWLISHALKLGVARPRPDVVAHLVDVHDLSFPSGHAMLSAVTYLTLGALLSRSQDSPHIRYFFMGMATVLSLLIGMIRVFLGVHYPTDVLAGWCAGAAWASCCWLLSRWFLPAREVADESSAAVD